MGRSAFGPTISGLAREFGSITPRPQIPSIPRPNYGPVFGRQDTGGQFGQMSDPRIVPLPQRPMEAPIKYGDPFQQQQGEWSGGALSAAGGEWATLDGMNGFIQSASANTGVPANLIKAMLAREGAFGTDKNVVGLRGERIYAFNGIFESTAKSYGIDFNRMVNDDGYAVWAMGRVLQGIKENNPELGSWDNIAKYYFSGPNWQNDGWTDEVGNTVQNYVYGPTGVITRMNYLDGLGGGRSWSGNWSSITPRGNVYDWGEFGMESSNGYYQYGTQYGLNGTQHTGVDITGNWNDPYYSPISGTVTCGGTGIGAGADGGGCAAFNTMRGGGAGRVEVLGDDGRMYIFGHSQLSNVRPGQRVDVGQQLGTLGWANSDHIHLEVRERDPSTPSGWRIVNPGGALGGGSWNPQPEVTGWRRWLQ